ncbi:hypothetical protein EJ07DRAFT_160402 [Lizonia empirigonia]|nr:hypothetical protein EJ07DRAFT_160402 [Lizonia empirigonia]
MLGPTECQISCGTAVSLQWNEGPDGVLELQIRHSKDAPGGIQGNIEANNPSLWSYSEKCQSNASTVRFEAKSASGFPSHTTDDKAQGADIRDKLKKGWAKTMETLQRCIIPYYDDPIMFFGMHPYKSKEEFSYQSPEDTQNELYKFRNPFHQINLALKYNEGLQSVRKQHPNFLETHYRTTYLEKLHRGYNHLKGKDRNAVWKRFERNIDQGNCLCQLVTETPGLLLTVGSFLSKADLSNASSILSKNHSLVDLFGQDVVQDSKKYNAVAQRFQEYLQSAKREINEDQNGPAKRQRFQWPNQVPAPQSLPQSPSQESQFGMSSSLQEPCTSIAVQTTLPPCDDTTRIEVDLRADVVSNSSNSTQSFGSNLGPKSCSAHPELLADSHKGRSSFHHCDIHVTNVIGAQGLSANVLLEPLKPILEIPTDLGTISVNDDLSSKDVFPQSLTPLRPHEGMEVTNQPVSLGEDAGQQGQLGVSNIKTAWMATWAEMNKLEKIIGGHLFAGMKASRFRQREEDLGRTTLTDAVRLHPANKEEDLSSKDEIGPRSKIANW